MTATFGGLTAEQWNEIARYLGPSPVIETVAGIRIPRNHYPMDRWGAIEDRIDSALSSANGILNFVLGPVRAFVHDVLHPIFYVADQALGFAFDLIRDLLGDAINAARDAGSAIAAGTNWAIAQARNLVDAARADLTATFNAIGTFLGGVINGVRSDLTAAISFSAGIASGLISDAKNVAAQGLSDLRSWATSAVNAARNDLSGLVHGVETVAAQGLSDLRQWATTAVGAAEDFASRAAADLRQWATDAINLARTGIDAALHAIRYDIIDPLVSDVERLLGAAGHDFAGIMKVLYDAAEWIVFVSTHIVPDVKSLIQGVEDLAGKSIQDVVAVGASAGRDFVL